MTEPIYKARGSVVLTEMHDGTGMLLDLDSKFYFQLNRSALMVWQRLSAAEGGCTVAELARCIQEHYKIPEQRALDDVAALIGELVSEELVET